VRLSKRLLPRENINAVNAHFAEIEVVL